MHIQTTQRVKGFTAQVTFIDMSVPRPLGRFILDRAVPADHVLRDGFALVLAADETVELIAVEAPGLGATGILEMVRHSSGGGEAATAEGAQDLGSSVNARVQMLPRALGQRIRTGARSAGTDAPA